jgi:hypothetical protein
LGGREWWRYPGKKEIDPGKKICSVTDIQNGQGNRETESKEDDSSE